MLYQSKIEDVRILLKRDAILKLSPSHVKYARTRGPHCNKFIIRFMTDPLYIRSKSAINLITNNNQYKRLLYNQF